MNMTNKVAVVTGGGKGLGRDISLAFAKAGADVVVVGRTREPLDETVAAIRKIGREAIAVDVDAADVAGVDRCRDEVLEHFGRVDALINNAGIGGPAAPMWELDPEEWNETLRVNTTGPFLCSRAFLPTMVEQQSGSIIFIGSMTGKRPLVNRTAYAASKIAVVGIARTLALETGPYNIRVNVISPGPMEGERMKWVLETQAEEQGTTPEEIGKRLRASSPLNRFVSTQNVAAMTVFMCSDDAASTTGEDINASSGICMY